MVQNTDVLAETAGPFTVKNQNKRKSEDNIKYQCLKDNSVELSCVNIFFYKHASFSNFDY